MTNEEILSLNGYEFRKYLDGLSLTLPYGLYEEENYGLMADILVATSNNITTLTSLLSLAKLNVRMYKKTDADKYSEFVDKRDIIEVYLKAYEQSNKTVSRLITIKQMEMSELNMCEFRKGWN